jgi:predicted ATP-dependent endonuclease of OLD family
MMQDAFLDREKVKSINETLAKKKGEISDKTLSVSLDTTSRASWETGIMPHLDEVPLTLVGKGEQNSVKIKLAMESSADSHLILIEEAENHLSFSNLNALISHIADRRGKRQLVITTHSSFVLNKLGVESVFLFHRGISFTLKALTKGTQEYFMRLPGHDTLRLILAKRSILVEGPSDELIVQAAYKKQHGKMPLEAGIDVISVRSLAFTRFLEIAVLLDRPVAVVTDNDGKVAALGNKYQRYTTNPKVGIFYDSDEHYPTLEPQLLKANGRPTIEKVLGKTFVDDDALLEHMMDNKSDTALKFFTTSEPWNVPGYIRDAIS